MKIKTMAQKIEEAKQREEQATQNLGGAIQRLKPFYQENGGSASAFIKDVIDSLIDGKKVDLGGLHYLDRQNFDAIINVLAAMHVQFAATRLILIDELRNPETTTK